MLWEGAKGHQVSKNGEPRRAQGPGDGVSSTIPEPLLPPMNKKRRWPETFIIWATQPLHQSAQNITAAPLSPARGAQISASLSSSWKERIRGSEPHSDSLWPLPPCRPSGRPLLSSSLLSPSGLQLPGCHSALQAGIKPLSEAPASPCLCDCTVFSSPTSHCRSFPGRKAAASEPDWRRQLCGSPSVPSAHLHAPSQTAFRLL